MQGPSPEMETLPLPRARDPFRRAAAGREAARSLLLPPSGPAASPPAVLGRDGAQSVLRARHPHPRGAQQAENTPREKGDFLLIWVFLLVKNIIMKREFLLIWVAVLLMTEGEPAAGAWQDPD